MTPVFPRPQKWPSQHSIADNVVRQDATKNWVEYLRETRAKEMPENACEPNVGKTLAYTTWMLKEWLRHRMLGLKMVRQFCDQEAGMSRNSPKAPCSTTLTRPVCAKRSAFGGKTNSI